MNGIRVICDTNPLVYMLDGNVLIGTFLSNKQVYLSFITELELYGKRNLSFQEKATIEQMIKGCFVAEINPAIKQIYIELRRKYSIKLPDAIIAATAIYLDMPLLTSDKGFQKIEELI
jgi:predicted nucleic acid-binding protein